MKVTLYTIADAECPHCVSAKNYLKEKGVEFEEKNVAENRTYLAEMLEISNKFAGVPVADIDGKILKGFTQTEYDAALMPAVSNEASPNSAGQPQPETPVSMPVVPAPSNVPGALSDSAPVQPNTATTEQPGPVPAEEEAKQKINDVLSSLEQKSAPTSSPDLPDALPDMAGTAPQMSSAPAMSTVSEPAPMIGSTTPTMPLNATPSNAPAPVESTTPQAPQTSDLPSVPNFPNK